MLNSFALQPLLFSPPLLLSSISPSFSLAGDPNLWLDDGLPLFPAIFQSLGPPDCLRGGHGGCCVFRLRGPFGTSPRGHLHAGGEAHEWHPQKTPPCQQNQAGGAARDADNLKPGPLITTFAPFSLLPSPSPTLYFISFFPNQ